MAQVFLSYVRGDAAKARSIATALEEAGHTVWWDRHIKSGAQYSKEIEEALKAAEAIVVLWSEQSVDSAWVRDEAAFGRDCGRLVPAKIGKTEPPLGFRQYQTTDLSRWKGQAASEAFQGMLDVIDGLSGKPTTDRRPRRREGVQAFLRSPLPLLAGALGILIAALFIWRSWAGRPEPPVVTVMAATSSPAAEALASDLFVKLGSLQSSRADSLLLVEPRSGTEADYAFKIGGSPGEAKANLVLTGPKGILLWSREFEQPGGNQSDLRQQIAFSAGEVLRCATDALAPGHPRLGLPILKLFLNGCAHFSDLVAQDPRPLVSTFREVTESAPRFAGGWSKLVLAQMFALRIGNLNDPVLRKQLSASIDRARQEHPEIPEPDLAEAWLQSPRPIIAWMRPTERAVSKDPQHAEALINRATGYLHVGRCNDAVDDSRRAADSEPLYPAARSSLVENLAHCGMQNEARHELETSERLWPGASSVRITRMAYELYYGDPELAARLLDSGNSGFSRTAVRLSFLEARMHPTRENISEAIRMAGAGWPGAGRNSGFLRTLAIFGRTDEVAHLLLTTNPELIPGVVSTLFEPHFRELRRHPRFMQIAHRLELIPYWQETGKWPDFCFEPDLPYDCKAEAAKLS